MTIWGSKTPWPWQQRSHDELTAKLSAGQTRLCVTGPTGSGKSLSMLALVRHELSAGGSVVLYTSRRLLLEQLMRVCNEERIGYGVHAAQHEDLRNDGEPLQLAMSSTMAARVFQRRAKAVDREEMDWAKAEQHWKLPQSTLVIVDELHMNRGDTVQRLFDEHERDGAKLVAYTATPLEVSHLCTGGLVQTATLRECRQHGALVPAHVYGCPELDASKLKPTKTGEFNYRDIVKQVWSPTIFGHVYREWCRTNQDARQTLVFGPGVPESLWLAEQFARKGVRAAHIDGEHVWVDGEMHESDPQVRRQVLAEWNSGGIQVVCNRFVMREGIDAPSCHHLVLATPIGSLLSYVQIVGRVLRRSDATPDHVVINDHGGNAWRHGSPNQDRDWQALWDKPTRLATEVRLERMRSKKDPEPITCPKCRAVRTSGPKCWQCGHESKLSSRLIVQLSGELKELTGDVLRARKVREAPDTQKLWDRMFWSCRKAHTKLDEQVRRLEQQGHPTAEAKRAELEKRLSRAMTFSQLYAAFFLENHYYPPRTLNNMPVDDDAYLWHAKVREVPAGKLRGAERKRESALPLPEAPF